MKGGESFLAMVEELHGASAGWAHYSRPPERVHFLMGQIAKRLRDWSPSDEMAFCAEYDATVRRLAEIALAEAVVFLHEGQR